MSPPVRLTAARFVNACLEIVNGLRPANHLRSLTLPGDTVAVVTAMNNAARRLHRTAGAGDSRDRQIKLHRMRVCEPRGGVIEIAAVIGTAERCWGAAFRLEHRHGRWLCTAAAVL